MVKSMRTERTMYFVLFAAIPPATPFAVNPYLKGTVEESEYAWEIRSYQGDSSHPFLQQ